MASIDLHAVETSSDCLSRDLEWILLFFYMDENSSAYSISE